MRVELGSLLGVFTDPESIALTIVVYLAKPGAEPPSISEEASEVRYFGPDEIPWHELAFPTTVDAITGWVASTRRQPNPYPLPPVEGEPEQGPAPAPEMGIRLRCRQRISEALPFGGRNLRKHILGSPFLAKGRGSGG